MPLPTDDPCDAADTYLEASVPVDEKANAKGFVLRYQLRRIITRARYVRIDASIKMCQLRKKGKKGFTEITSP